MATGLLIGWLIFAPDQEEDDRPPIIVNNGSVILTIDKATTRGEWVKVVATKIYRHLHPGPPPTKFSVQISGMNCGNYTLPLEGTTVRLTYGQGGNTVTRVINIQNHLTIDFGNDTVEETDQYTLTVPNPARIQAVDVDGKSCTAQGDPRITIDQER